MTRRVVDGQVEQFDPITATWLPVHEDQLAIERRETRWVLLWWGFWVAFLPATVALGVAAVWALQTFGLWPWLW